jgi:excinuclease UvrABC helicase subunit UvrB
MDDGKFEVTIISSIWQWLTLHVTRFLRKPLNVFCPKMIQFQTDKLEMVFTGNTFFQIDGETLDSFPEERKRLMVRVESHMEMIVP